MFSVGKESPWEFGLTHLQNLRENKVKLTGENKLTNKPHCGTGNTRVVS